MKTIFVSALEGIEVKNILRTNVINTVLKDGGVRVVLLVKNEERAAYYRKEFNGPHITYAVVPYDRSLGKGIDRLFALLKFLLLRTETTKLRRRMAYEAGGSWWTYVSNGFLNMLLAHAPLRRLSRALDYRLVKNTSYHVAVG